MSRLCRDFQVQKVYNFDSAARIELGDSLGSMTLDQCKALAKRVLNDFGQDTCTVKDGRGRRSACGTATYIKLPVKTRTREVVLHEIAHVIVCRHEQTMRVSFPSHGHVFVGLLVYLLKTYTELSEEWMVRELERREICVEYGVVDRLFSTWREAA